MHWIQVQVRTGRILQNTCSLWCLSSVQFSRSVVSDSLQLHKLQHTRPPCPSPTPGVHSNSRRGKCLQHSVLNLFLICDCQRNWKSRPCAEKWSFSLPPCTQLEKGQPGVYRCWRRLLFLTYHQLTLAHYYSKVEEVENSNCHISDVNHTLWSRRTSRGSLIEISRKEGSIHHSEN